MPVLRSSDGVVEFAPPVGKARYEISYSGHKQTIIAHTPYEAWSLTRLPGSPDYSSVGIKLLEELD